MDKLSLTEHGIPRSTLQWIAIITMVIDHINTIFHPFTILHLHYGYFSQGLAFYLDHGLYDIGRIAFPIFAFLIADGCRRTRSLGKYALRLGIFAIISGPFYNFGFFGDSLISRPIQSISDVLHAFRPVGSSVMGTLFAGALFIWLASLIIRRYADRSKTKMLLLLTPAFALIYLGTAIFQVEYWEIGMPMIVSLYFVKSRDKQIMAMFGFFLYIYTVLPTWNYIAWNGLPDFMLELIGLPDLLEILGVVVALILIYFYNEKKQGKPRQSRLIYLFYPGHLFILGIIREILVILGVPLFVS